MNRKNHLIPQQQNGEKDAACLQMSDTLLVAGLLALVGGFLDACTYLLRGQVFAYAETGNIILLGVNLVSGQWGKVPFYLLPILSFICGVIVTEMIRSRFLAHPRVHWRQLVVAAEALLLCGVAFIPLGEWNMPANIIVAFVCAMQFESFRKLRGSAYATTMCTGNLRTATELFYHWRKSGERHFLRSSLQYYLLILLFFAGACLGGVLAGPLQEKAVLIGAALLMVVFFMMFFRGKSRRRESARTGWRRMERSR